MRFRPSRPALATGLLASLVAVSAQAQTVKDPRPLCTAGTCLIRHSAWGTPLDHDLAPDRVRVPNAKPATAAAPEPTTLVAAASTPQPTTHDLASAPASPPTTPAFVPAESLPDGRYICSQGGLTRSGTVHWGYFDLSGNAYKPFTGSGGRYTYDGKGIARFDGGIFDRYEWVGIARQRKDGVAEVALVEKADLDAFLAGKRQGDGSGIVVRCGWNGTR